MAKTEYDVDDILPLVGEFSRFQIIVEIFLCIVMIPQSLQNLIMYFAGLNSPWRCAASSSVCTFPRNLTFDSESQQYKARCSMNRSDWEFVQSNDYSIVTQVSEKSLFSISNLIFKPILIPFDRLFAEQAPFLYINIYKYIFF